MSKKIVVGCNLRYDTGVGINAFCVAVLNTQRQKQRVYAPSLPHLEPGPGRVAACGSNQCTRGHTGPAAYTNDSGLHAGTNHAPNVNLYAGTGYADHDTNHAPTGYADAGTDTHQHNRTVNCGTGIWR
jgi:hypothetical protein